MEALKISQFPSITTPSLSGVTVVVDSGTTYNTSLETLKDTIVDNVEHTFIGNQVITGNLTVNGQIFNTEIIPQVTYAELLTLINTSGLTAFSYYTLTDFATTYWMLDGRGNEVNGGVPAVGNIEPLILFSTSNFTIDPKVYSLIYHDDIIEYDWDYNRFINDAAYTDIPNFKGVIIYRKENLLNNSAGWDIRAVKFRRWESTAPLWQSNITYNPNDIVIQDQRIWRSMTINLNKEPALPSSSSDWVMMINLTETIYWNSNSTGITFDGMTILSGPLYFDYPSINLGNPLSYDNEIKPSTSNFGDVSSSLLNIILFGTTHNTHFSESCSVLTVGTLSSNIKLDYGCYRMIFGQQNKNITINSDSNALIFSEGIVSIELGNGVRNSLFGYFTNNIKLGSYSSNVTFGVSCRSINIDSYCDNIFLDSRCSKISIGYGCTNIDIESDCSNITMHESCSNIEIGSLSKSLIFDNACVDIILPFMSSFNKFDCHSSGDLTGAPLEPFVKGNYHCTITTHENLNNYLHYYDINNDPQFIIIPVI